MTRSEKRNLLKGLAFVSPWLAGFLVFTVYPLACSLYFSLSDYSILSAPVFIGSRNYSDLAMDEVFWTAAFNTFVFAAVAIPLGLLFSFLLALLLNVEVPWRGIFRTIFFLPSLVPMVCLAVLWQWMLNGDLGLVNAFLRPFVQGWNGIFGTNFHTPNWLADEFFSKWGLVFASLWAVGNTVVIFLASLQDVPRHLHESAEIDGAGFLSRTLHITIPMISPVIYFNLLMGIIGCFQVFAIPFVMTGGGDGPNRSLLFVATYLFQNAFEYWNMGYASAIGVVLFLMILALTLAAIRLSEKHVHYAGK